MIQGLDHIAIAVKSLEESVPFYRDQLGLTFEGYEEVTEQKVRVAFFHVGEVRIELLEPTSDDSPISKFLAERGNGKPAFPRLPQGVALSAHNDHRIAMSLALLGLRQPEVKIRDLLDDPMVVRKSFPQFWNIWEHLA